MHGGSWNEKGPVPSTMATCPTCWASFPTRASIWPSTRSVGSPPLSPFFFPLGSAHGPPIPVGLTQLNSRTRGDNPGVEKHHGPGDPGEPFQALDSLTLSLTPAVQPSGVSGHMIVRTPYLLGTGQAAVSNENNTALALLETTSAN